ncbi:MAG: sigma-54 interaction domain-containing protein [Eubacteriaceae bacterium]
MKSLFPGGVQFNHLDDFFMEKILDNIGLPIFVLTFEQRVVYLNKEGKKLLNEQPAIFKERKLNEIFERTRRRKETQIELFEDEINSIIVTPIWLDVSTMKCDHYLIILQKKFPNINLKGKTKLPKEKQRKRENIIGQSRAFLQPVIELERVAKSKMRVLLLGESGSGKSLIAEYIHRCSQRKDFPFLSINCGAIPNDLLESELFGYMPGSFTGASNQGKKGIFELADGGTIFLDEIGEMPLPLQVKLLHVLESGVIIPVGGNVPIEVDVRIISATNKNLIGCIERGVFRNDLYWRINSFITTIPSLKERKEDIIPLALFYLNEYNKKNGSAKFFSPQTLKLMLSYHWPGNVRELKNTTNCMCVLSESRVISENLLPDKIRKEIDEKSENDFVFDILMDQIKASAVKDLYLKNKTSSSLGKKLNISQSTAYRLIEKYKGYSFFE